MRYVSVYKSSMIRRNLTGLLLAAVVVLAGCASGDEASVEQRRADWDAKKAQSAASEKAPQLDAMVRAVSAGKPGAPADLKFDIGARPVVGVPLQVMVAITATSADVATLEVVFNAADGLQIVSGGNSARFQKPKSGETNLHTVTVLPQRDGVFYMSAVALIDTVSDSGSVARTFSIPIIVGEGGAAELSKPSPSVVDSRGERLAPLPAEESR